MSQSAGILDPPAETAPVRIPEWPSIIRVRLLTVQQMDDLLRWGDVKADADLDGESMTVKVVIMCAVDDAGSPIFSKEDYEQVRQLPASVISRISNAAYELNALTTESREAIRKKLRSDGHREVILRMAVASGRTVREMSELLTTREMAELQEWYCGEPRGEARADIHAAQIVCAILNTVGRGKRGGGKFTLDDCLLKFKEPPPPRERPKTPDRERAAMQERKAIVAGIAAQNDPSLFAEIEEVLQYEDLQRTDPEAAARQGPPRNRYTLMMGLQDEEQRPLQVRSSP